jgi:hypothetical protein
MAGSPVQRIVPFRYIQEGQCATVCHSQRDIQIPQSHIAIDAQDIFPLLRQGCCDARADRGLSRSALTGENCQKLAQTSSPPNLQFRFIIKPFRTKSKSNLRIFQMFFIIINKKLSIL